MTPRDTDEWRRPWTSADEPRPHASHVTVVDGAAPVTTDAEGAGLPAGDEDVPADTGEARTADAPVDAPADAEAAADVDAATDVRAGDHLPAPDPTASPRPLPPPTDWQPQDDGPGSPAGSVRPPDITGTVTAPPKERRRGSGVVVGLVAGLTGALLGTGGLYAVLDAQGRLDGQSAATPVAPAAPRPADEPVGSAEPVQPGQVPEGNESNVVPGVARAVLPSVVRIDIIVDDEAIGLGSGVVYREDGFIITNEHVVAEADLLEVKLATGESLEAEIVGTDPLNDLAVLRVERDGLTPLPLRAEGLTPVVGETAIAIGSPFGLDASVTAGVVSAINRDITVPSDAGQPIVIPAVLQTDAAINPGNSGGALVDSSGRLIGINTAILSATGGSQGVGFAIPVEQAVISADQLIETGEVRTGFLGVRGEPVTPEVAEAFGLDRASGAIIGEVTPGSAAADAGLQEEDIIVAVDDAEVTSMSDLVVIIRRTMPGDTVTVEFVRDGELQQTEVTLGDRPENP